jgi:hypothetical protein
MLSPSVQADQERQSTVRRKRSRIAEHRFASHCSRGASG